MWDTSYVLLRPHSMPGGYLHSPVWTPYALYGTVDYIYGWPAYNSHNGFTAAQSTMNILESSLYIWYLWIVYSSGVLSVGEGRGAPGARIAGALGRGRVVSGRMAGTAALVGFGAAVMTLSKTLLYCEFSEPFSSRRSFFPFQEDEHRICTPKKPQHGYRSNTLLSQCCRTAIRVEPLSLVHRTVRPLVGPLGAEFPFKN
jgi:hypothetical protein